MKTVEHQNAQLVPYVIVQEHGANVNHSARAWRGHICTNQTYRSTRRL